MILQVIVRDAAGDEVYNQYVAVVDARGKGAAAERALTAARADLTGE